MPRTDGDSWDLASSVGATATMVAAARAVASKRSAAVINDPFAGPLVRAVGMEFFTNLVSGGLDFFDVGTPWVPDVFELRTQYFDEFVSTACKDGMRQVVIIASGLDARSYRLPWPAGTTLYEVDQPNVIEFKSEAMRDLRARPTADLHTVGVDLRLDWPAALLAAGFDPDRATLWTVEGLLMGYLSSDAEGGLLDHITTLSGVGSRLVADYLRGTTDKLSELMRRTGESWLRHGFTADFADLFFNGERDDVELNLRSHGWFGMATSIDSLLRTSGAERAANELAGIDMAYIGCTLN
jgi:methyltransferase (TIGR00027 family)